jgi:hypothetical protein
LSATNRSSNGLTLPSSASIVSAAIASDAFDRFSARTHATRPIALMISVPLMSARPSFAASSIGASPTFFNPARALMRLPATNASPWPMYAAAMCASGARSPLAPTEPLRGTTGTNCFAWRRINCSTSSSETPE